MVGDAPFHKQKKEYVKPTDVYSHCWTCEVKKARNAKAGEPETSLLHNTNVVCNLGVWHDDWPH